MSSWRRTLFYACLSTLVPGMAIAQAPSSRASNEYPAQPIRLVVPWPAGGTTDVIARMLGQNLTADLKQTVVVENIGGAGGNIGTQKFVRSKPDGYTLLMASSSTNAANPHLYKSLGFEPITDFTPIALVARVPSVMVVGADSPFRSVRDILSTSRSKPEGLSYASAGVGSSAHLAGELLKTSQKFRSPTFRTRASDPPSSTSQWPRCVHVRHGRDLEHRSRKVAANRSRQLGASAGAPRGPDVR